MKNMTVYHEEGLGSMHGEALRRVTRVVDQGDHLWGSLGYLGILSMKQGTKNYFEVEILCKKSKILVNQFCCEGIDTQ